MVYSTRMLNLFLVVFFLFSGRSPSVHGTCYCYHTPMICILSLKHVYFDELRRALRFRFSKLYLFRALKVKIKNCRNGQCASVLKFKTIVKIITRFFLNSLIFKPTIKNKIFTNLFRYKCI